MDDQETARSLSSQSIPSTREEKLISESTLRGAEIRKLHTLPSEHVVYNLYKHLLICLDFRPDFIQYLIFKPLSDPN